MFFFQRGWGEELWMMNRRTRMVEDMAWRLTPRYHTTTCRVATKIKRNWKNCYARSTIISKFMQRCKIRRKIYKIKKYSFLGFEFKYTLKKN